MRPIRHRAPLLGLLLFTLLGCDDEPVEVCPTDTPDRCEEACVDLASSRAHCGECGVACGDGELCMDGACAGFCPTGQILTEGGTCASLDRDPENCGEVGRACAPGQLCADGLCVVACPEPLVECGGGCVDLAADVDHCGACDNACDADRACHAGACTDPCLGLPTATGEPLFALHMLVPRGNAARIAHAYLISDALRELGIVGVVQRVGFSTILTQFDPATRASGPAGYDLLFVAFSVQDPRPISEGLGCGAANNFTGWCNSAWDEARTRFETSLNATVKAEAAREMQELFVDELPMQILYFRNAVWGLPSDLGTFDGEYAPFSPHYWTGPSNVLLAMPVAPTSLNPLFRGPTYGVYIMSMLFERLFQSDPDPASPTYGGRIPMLATDIPDIVATGVGTEHTVTLDLRASSFSDGHAVDAYDVAFTYQLFLRPEADVAVADDLRTLGLDSRSIEVVDADTIRFRFPAPATDYAYLMDLHVLPMHYWLPHDTTAEAAAAYATLLDGSGSYVGPVPVEGDAFDDGTDTFGSGAYRAIAGEGWDPSTGTMRLERNPGSGTAIGDVDIITVRVLPREDVLTELSAGASLLVDRNYAFRPEELDAFTGIRSLVSTSLGYQLMGANLASPHVSDVQVRRAIDLALPRQQIIDETAGGLGTIARGYVSPASPFYDPDFGEGGPRGPTFDVAAARATMRAAGYTDLSADAPALRTVRARVCNTEAVLADWLDAGEIDATAADQILADLARASVGR